MQIGWVRLERMPPRRHPHRWVVLRCLRRRPPALTLPREPLFPWAFGRPLAPPLVEGRLRYARSGPRGPLAPEDAPEAGGWGPAETQTARW